MKLNKTIINTYLGIKQALIGYGFAEEIDWAEDVKRPKSAKQLAFETIWVICNSGMKYKIAKQIYKKIVIAIKADKPVLSVFKNKNKARAIEKAWTDKSSRYYHLRAMDDVDAILRWFQTFDGIGPITKYHLARNVGIDVCKPDRHLVRIAKSFNTDPHTLCQFITDKTGDRIGAVDVVLWRAAVEGLL